MNHRAARSEARLLAGRFEWIRHLGGGGQGYVVLAHDRVRNERVALKLLEAETSGASALKREFRWLRDVIHPHLVSMLELIIEPELECLVLEYVDGVDLFRYLGAESRSPELTGTRTVEATDAPPTEGEEAIRASPERIVPAFLQLIDALAFLDERGLVHGDLKPENILVEGERVVILDFGIARLRNTRSSKPIGTLPYMAPEQFVRDGTLSGATDRYALGVLLYRALSGFLPFVGTAQQVVTAKRGEPPRLGHAPLEELAHALMHPDPSARPDLHAIQRILERESGLGRRGSKEARTESGNRAWAHTEPRGALVGRESELDELTRAVESSRVAVLIGNAGLGKTTILDRFCAERASVVLRSRCYANESIRWNAVDGLLDTLLRETLPASFGLPSEAEALAKLFPALRRVESTASTDVPVVELVRRAARGFGSLVNGSERTLLVVDDVQWADADSMIFLREVLIAHPEIGLVVATRGPDGRSRTIVDRLVATGREVQVIDIGPLAKREAALLAQTLDETAGTLEHDLISLATGGVPFLIEELAWASRRRGAGPRDIKDAGSLLTARLAEIDGTSHELLSLLAVNEAPLETNILLSAIHGTGQKLVRQLVGERFCRVEQELGSKLERIDVFHDFIRRELLSAISSEARREAHARLATATLEAHPERHDDIARHFFGAQDPRAVRFALAAANDARAVFAFDRAAGWLMRVLETPLEKEASRDVRRLLAECRRLAEHHVDAAEVLEALAATEDPEVGRDTLRQAAEQWLTAGHLERGLSMLDSLSLEGAGDDGRNIVNSVAQLLTERLKVRILGTEKLAEPRAARRARTLLSLAGAVSPSSAETRKQVDLAWTVSGCFALIDPLRAGKMHAAGLLRAISLGDPERTLRSLVGEAVYSGMFGTMTRRRSDRLLAEVEVLADKLDNHARGLAVSTRSIIEIQRGNFLAGVDATLAGLDLLMNHPKTVGWEMMAARHFYMHALYYLGRFRELTHHVESEYREAAARQNNHRMSDASLNHATIAWLLARGPEVARARVAEGNAFFANTGQNIQRYYTLTSAITVALWEGRADLAWRAVIEQSASALSAPVIAAEGPRTDALHVIARAAIAEVKARKSFQAAVLAFTLTALLGAERSPHAKPLALLQLSGLANSLGATDLAERLAGRAGRALRAQGLLAYAEAADSFHDGRVHLRGEMSEALARVVVPGLAS